MKKSGYTNRNELKTLDKEIEYECYGKFIRCVKLNGKSIKYTCLVLDVKVDRFIFHHMWLPHTKHVKMKGYTPIQFNGKINKYYKDGKEAYGLKLVGEIIILPKG